LIFQREKKVAAIIIPCLCVFTLENGREEKKKDVSSLYPEKGGGKLGVLFSFPSPQVVWGARQRGGEACGCGTSSPPSKHLSFRQEKGGLLFFVLHTLTLKKG